LDYEYRSGNFVYFWTIDYQNYRIIDYRTKESIFGTWKNYGCPALPMILPQEGGQRGF
jgi:hypothetical protein